MRCSMCREQRSTLEVRILSPIGKHLFNARLLAFTKPATAFGFSFRSFCDTMRPLE
jgi:hypothetical protein